MGIFCFKKKGKPCKKGDGKMKDDSKLYIFLSKKGGYQGVHHKIRNSKLQLCNFKGVG